MHLFKTSGATFNSVIKSEKHAFKCKPKDIKFGDLVLVSKNKGDLGCTEKQIGYIMKFKEIRELKHGEASELWPGNEGRWKYLVICTETLSLKNPFNLEDILGNDAKKIQNSYDPLSSNSRTCTSSE